MADCGVDEVGGVGGVGRVGGVCEVGEWSVR